MMFSVSTKHIRLLWKTTDKIAPKKRIGQLYYWRHHHPHLRTSQIKSIADVATISTRWYPAAANRSKDDSTSNQRSFHRKSKSICSIVLGCFRHNNSKLFLEHSKWNRNVWWLSFWTRLNNRCIAGQTVKTLAHHLSFWQCHLSNELSVLIHSFPSTILPEGKYNHSQDEQ